MTYKVDVFNSSGSLLARLPRWREVEFTQRTSEPGEIRIVTGGTATGASYLNKGNWVNVARNGTDVFAGEFVWKEPFRGEKGADDTVTIMGQSNRLPKRVVKPSGTAANISHYGAMDDNMKWLVRQHYLSGTANADRVLSDFTVQSDAGAATSATLIAKRKDKVDDLLKKYGHAYSVDWWLDVDLEAPSWEFKTASPRRGADKSGTIVFSTDRGNARNLRFTEDAVDTVNYVFAAGPSSGGGQEVSEHYSGSEPTGWDRQEGYIQANDDDTRTAHAEALLGIAGTDIDSVTLDVDETDGCGWLSDWEIGDKVTVYDAVYDKTVAAKIQEVTVKLDASKDHANEQISVRVGNSQLLGWERELAGGPGRRVGGRERPAVDTANNLAGREQDGLGVHHQHRR